MARVLRCLLAAVLISALCTFGVYYREEISQNDGVHLPESTASDQPVDRQSGKERVEAPLKGSVLPWSQVED